MQQQEFFHAWNCQKQKANRLEYHPAQCGDRIRLLTNRVLKGWLIYTLGIIFLGRRQIADKKNNRRKYYGCAEYGNHCELMEE